MPVSDLNIQHPLEQEPVNHTLFLSVQMASMYWHSLWPSNSCGLQAPIAAKVLKYAVNDLKDMTSKLMTIMKAVVNFHQISCRVQTGMYGSLTGLIHDCLSTATDLLDIPTQMT